MTADEKCAATAPRATLCIDELLIANLHALDPQVSGGSELAAEVTTDLRAKRSSDRQAAGMHRINCLGASDAAYAEAVVACWTIEDCEPFASCVTREEAKHPRAPAAPPVDPDAPPEAPPTAHQGASGGYARPASGEPNPPPSQP